MQVKLVKPSHLWQNHHWQTGWWFQTFCYFPYSNIWDNPSHWLSYFSRWLLHHQPAKYHQLWHTPWKLPPFFASSWLLGRYRGSGRWMPHHPVLGTQWALVGAGGLWQGMGSPIFGIATWWSSGSLGSQWKVTSQDMVYMVCHDFDIFWPYKKVEA